MIDFMYKMLFWTHKLTRTGRSSQPVRSQRLRRRKKQHHDQRVLTQFKLITFITGLIGLSVLVANSGDISFIQTAQNSQRKWSENASN